MGFILGAILFLLFKDIGKVMMISLGFFVGALLMSAPVVYLLMLIGAKFF